MKECLHCCIMEIIAEWTLEHHPDGESGLLNVDTLMDAIVAVTADFAATMRERERNKIVTDMGPALARAVKMRVTSREAGTPTIN